VDKFKRTLFLQNTSSTHLKIELTKLAENSADLVDINFGNFDLQGATATNHTKPVNGSAIAHESE